jgi:hypothetical protein
MPCRQLNPDQPNRRPGVGYLQGKFNLLVAKILNFSCGWQIPNWLLGQLRVGCLQDVESGGMAELSDTLYWGSMDPWTLHLLHPSF